MRTPSRVFRTSFGLAVALGLLASQAIGCKKEGGGAGPTGSAAAAPSGSAAAAPSGSAAVAPSGSAAAPSPSGEPVAPSGSGVTELSPLAGKADCLPQTTELATYLQRGDIAIAGRDGGVSTSWMVQLPNKPDAQIAFGGYDGQAKQLARIRGIGTSREHAPQVFSTGNQWTVTWFDADGLAYTRPPWEMGTAPSLDHLSAVAKDLAEDVALAATSTGSLVAVAPFGPDHNQLGLFLFAPTEAGAPAVQALGLSRHSKRPRRPAVAADEGGYYVAWMGEGDALAVSHFDLKGKEADVAAIAPPGPKREDVSLITTPVGALAVWLEGDAVMARALDKLAQPSSPTVVVARGARSPDVTPMRDGALAVWVGKEGKTEGQIFSVKLSATGAPSAKGLLISDEGHAVKDRPAVAITGGRAAFAWTEVMSATVSTKRALLRTLEVACLP